jgi:hypothetical protein
MDRIVLQLLLSMYLLMPMAASAQTIAKNPLDYPLKQYALIIGIAVAGGFASWYAKVRKGELPGWSIHHLIGELATSAFAGMLCFWICEWMGAPSLLTATLAGIAGHMGTNAITLVEQWAAQRAQKALG